MMQLGIIIVLSLSTCCSGFLLDDRTQPQTTTAPTFSDKQFSILLDILADEKRSCLKLEERVVKLENELLATQKGVTNNYHTGTKNNESIGQQMGTVNGLDTKYMTLQSKYDSLHSKFEQLLLNHTSLEKFAFQLQQKLTSLASLKGVVNLGMLIDARNETNLLALELQMTNNKLSAVENDVSARKQDFIALFNKADSTEHELKHAKVLINNTMAKFQNQTLLQMDNLSSSLEHKFISMDAKQNMSQLQLSMLNSTIQILKYNQNTTSTNLTEELRKMSNRVSVMTCLDTNSQYSAGSIVPFKRVMVTNGISTTGVGKIKQTGTFICETAGLYLISAFILTNKNGAVTEMYRNNKAIAYGYFSTTGNHQTTTVVVLQRLDVNDVISIKAVNAMHIYGYSQTCLSIVQITM